MSGGEEEEKEEEEEEEEEEERCTLWIDSQSFGYSLISENVATQDSPDISYLLAHARRVLELQMHQEDMTGRGPQRE
jgi:hypothetical protein